MAARRSGTVRCDELVLVLLLFRLLFGAEGQAVPAACPATCTDAQAYFIASPTAPSPFTFGAIANNFNIAVVDLAGANNEDLTDLSTVGGIIVQASGEVRVPLPTCSCKGGVYTADNVTYTVQSGDSLSAIASVTYGGLVIYQDIATANNIGDPSLIEPGQQFVIPIPCTCVARPETPPAVALSYVIVLNDDYTLVASKFNTNADAVVSLNPSVNASALVAGQVIEVPLPACSFNLSTGSLLVAYDAYTVTAGTCVQCNCRASESGDPTGECVPFPASDSCSASLTCPGTNLTIGSSITVQKTASSCEVTTCSYDGYSTSAGILTKVQNETVTGICSEIATPPPPPPTPAGAPPPQASPPTTSPPARTLFPPPPPTTPGSNPGSGLSAPPPSSPAVLNEAWPALILATFAAILSTLL